MSSICLNCQAKLSCGCQKRVASDGKPVCGVCINAYEYALKAKKLKEDNTYPGTITGITIVHK